MDLDAAIVEDSFWTKMPYVTSISDPVADETREFRQIDTSDRIRFLSVITHTCEKFGLPVVLCTTPVRDREDDFTIRTLNSAHFDTFNRNMRAINDSTREAAISAGVPLVDLDRLLIGKERLLYDMFHFNKEGAKQAGVLIAKSLMPIINKTEPQHTLNPFARLFTRG